jgi:aspartate/methionine/tyrosine aminotransferase
LFILQLVYYGDLVIPRPTWVSYSPQAQIIGRMVRWANTQPQNGWRLTAEELDIICRDDPKRPRIVILNYPANPTGSTYSDQQLKDLAEVARKYGVVLLSDEIYGELHYEAKHVSIAKYYPEGTIISGGLSKWCGAGGWRLGSFVFPKGLKWLLDAMAIVASETFTATSAPIQYAAVTAFDGSPEIDQYLVTSRRVLKGIASSLVSRARRMHLSVPAPDGAFYLFPDFSFYKEKLRSKGILTSVELCRAVLNDTGVAMLPGSDFGRSPEELNTRIAFVDFDGREALRAAEEEYAEREIDDAFFRKYCPNLDKAFSRLVDWLTY